MYIKLGSINLQYYQETNDWIILGEILDSEMSYEKPILVRTTEELDIWFGKDFKDYSYLQELLNMGIVLYLHKPVSNETIGGEGYIDLDNYIEDNEVWLRDVELEWVGKVVLSPEKYKFRYNNGTEIKVVGLKVSSGGDLVVVEDAGGREFCTEETVRKELLNPINQISRIHKKPIKFHVFNSEDLWIYKDGGIFDIELLPQNLNLTSSSSDNRDTLIVSTPGLDTIEFTYLDYNSETNSFGVYENKDIIDQLEDIDQQYMTEIDPEKVATGYQTLMFSISGERSYSEDDYFVIPNSTHGTDISLWELFYFNIDKVPQKVKEMFEGKSTQVDSLETLKTGIERLGYTIITKDNKDYIYSKTIIPVTNFYKSTYIKVEPEIKITEAVLSRYITPGIEVVSKTIGRSSEFEDDLIKVVIEKTDDTYRTIITRYSYSEVFEGSLKYIPGEQRLDNLISQQSKLIRCNFYGDELRTGTYYLRGAVVENTNPEMYKYSLKQMLSTEYNDPVYPDYFLIPDKYKYTSDIITESPYPLFLDYAKEVGCQFLIENDVIDNLGDYIYNLTDDEENRLVYFFKPMTINYQERPAYYAYLRGLLLNEYSISVKDILYKTPTQDAFLEEDIEDQLKKYKSNYLVCDNQTYFYKDYQDGDTYITTGWTRFIAGKVFRELQKNSGDILGQQLLGVIRSKISDLIYSISSGFSIVRAIEITEFEPENNGQSLKITLETTMNDLVKNNVSLNITVNYNNNIYGTIS